jgi:hypothetical protein
VKKFSISGILSALLIIGLGLSNPSQRHYQESIVAEFEKFHGGISISVDQLLEMGHGNRNSFFLFSTYQYEMGNIGVKYWGIAGQVFFIKSYRAAGSEVESSQGIDKMV